MPKVLYKSKLLQIIQQFTSRDRTQPHFFAFKDVHDGLTAVKHAVDNLKVLNESPTGPRDNVNAKFRVQNHPAFMVVNGVIKIENIDYIFNNGLVTFNVVPPASANINSFYM